MSSFQHIQEKLRKFIKKYYLNELIKGLILFFSLGFLYFILTLLIEHFLWLNPLYRTLLFVLFILVEAVLLFKYILIPIFKIWGLKKGINEFEASKLIGNHFPEVSDKLLNMIQLNKIQQSSDLIEASIIQKSKELQPIPFKQAINFGSNRKYLKFALIPVTVWLLFYITGNSSIFNDSFKRVVDYKTAYKPPAPFSFYLENESLKILEGADLTINIETKGDVIPENVELFFLNENYFLKNNGFGKFSYTLSDLKKDVDFYVKANDVESEIFKIEVIPTPVITNLKMVLTYPKYVDKKNEVVMNSGNAIVPQGTKISWQIETHQTEKVLYKNQFEETFSFIQNSPNYFSFNKEMFLTNNYSINTSNSELENHESLQFLIDVIEDEFPNIEVNSNIDSISHGPVEFVGNLSDDYKVRKLQLIYYDKVLPENKGKLELDISKSSYSEFYYIFPEGIELEEGVDYEFYFEVFDNDGVNGSKSSKSPKFSYYKPLNSELNEVLLKEQKETISTISKSLEKSKEKNSELDKFKEDLQKKADINWNDTKKLEQFIDRQQQYEKMFEKQTDELEQNLLESPSPKDLQDKKEELLKRIEETKKMANQEKMLKELDKLTDKIKKEDLIDKLKEIAEKNKRNEQSLERILELTKRFYVEQKANQIADKLKNLGEEQEDVINEREEDENSLEKQKEISERFEDLKKDLNELDQQNKDLKRPMKLPNDPEKLKEIDENLKGALDQLEKNENQKAKKNQKSAGKKMKELGSSMEQSMMSMEGEMIDENIEDLRKIVENVIGFSFLQEDLMEAFSEGDNNHPEYPSNLKEQHVLKEYFEHIDDSLYMLSLRLVKMGSDIRNDVGEVHFNVDESLKNFSENLFEQGISNQHFVITSANDLANKLSDLLESLMNASMSMGKGKGGGKPEFTLPDIIKKQGELSEEMKEGNKKNGQNGDKNDDEKGTKQGNESEGNSEEMNEELFEIYKQQARLKELLKDVLGTEGMKHGSEGAEVVKQMEDLEKELLEQGYSNSVIAKMQKLSYELLKLEEAQKEQGTDSERKSETNMSSYTKRRIQELKLKNQYFNSTEILNRQSLPLRSIYKKKVQDYFKHIEE